MADAARNMPSPPPPGKVAVPALVRSNSISAASEDSQTAQDFINRQLQLEADAREAMPYQFDTCTRPLGPLRQTLFSCLTCSPPPQHPSDPHSPAGICYSCSISCHGEHELVELFGKRNFVCDCGTTRLPADALCTLRFNEKTGTKGGITGETPVATNRYNHNFANRFCGCREVYNPHQEKGTMFQCIGLGTVEDGGCGEDWWHPECVLGLSRDWYRKRRDKDALRDPVETATAGDGSVEPQPVDEAEPAKEEHPVPPGFPEEDSFEYFVCYKCVDANPWIKRYAGAPGFLPAVIYDPSAEIPASDQASAQASLTAAQAEQSAKKRKAEDDEEQPGTSPQRELKRHRSTPEPATLSVKNDDAAATSLCHYEALPPAPASRVSLFCQDDFREHICRCPDCFPRLKAFPQLLEEEETYEPPLSEDGDGAGAPSVGTGSLLDRGEAALSNVDRVRAIEGVMVYNHLKDKVKSFLQPFAESGQAVGAEDIKAYFEKLRGDVDGMKQAAADAAGSGGGDGGDGRQEQSGY